MGRETEKKGKETITIFFVVTVLFLASISPLIAQESGGSVTLSAPVGMAPNSIMRVRPVNDASGALNTPHRGVDYPASCGTSLSARGPLRCTTESGYGSVGLVNHACGVMERYAHLSACATSGAMRTGGGRGMVGAGSSTGCHLHYEIRINGTAVNPPSAYGKNLCDADTRRQLIDEAQRLLSGRAGGGGGAGSGTAATPSPTTPATTPTTPGETPSTTPSTEPSSITYVGPGEKDPRTGVENPGDGFYIIETVDGRTYTQVEQGNAPAVNTSLPPTTSNVVDEGGTSTEITGCGTDTWRAMVNQAVLQTRREMVMNERYIAKGDSVLTYSCFTGDIDNARQTLGILGESQRWVNAQWDNMGETVTVNRDLGQYSLDGALTNAALEPYEKWMAQYNHDYIGGLAVGSAGTIEYGEGSSAQAYSPCGTMARVWQLAKCMNVTDSPAFYKFSDLISVDPRKYPASLACFDSGISQTMIDIAQNKSATYSALNTYMTLLMPSPGTCAPAVATGVTVTRKSGTGIISTEVEYPDGVCITPGCSYINGGSGAGTCQVKGP